MKVLFRQLNVGNIQVCKAQLIRDVALEGDESAGDIDADVS